MIDSIITLREIINFVKDPSFSNFFSLYRWVSMIFFSFFLLVGIYTIIKATKNGIEGNYDNPWKD